MAETTKKNTDARMRGGAARSSDEAPVMGVEPRGSVIRLTNVANPLCGDERQERLDNGSRVNREVSAGFCGGAQGEIPWPTHLAKYRSQHARNRKQTPTLARP